MSKFDNLVKKIIELSTEKKDFNIAKKEWYIERIDYLPQSTCLCKHYPIKECCFIINSNNNETTMVGNCCIKHFEDIPTVDWYFQGLKRIRILKNPNIKLIQFLFAQNKLNDFEYKFLLSIHGKKKYTPRQKQCQKSILIKLRNTLVSKELGQKEISRLFI